MCAAVRHVHVAATVPIRFRLNAKANEMESRLRWNCRKTKCVKVAANTEAKPNEHRAAAATTLNRFNHRS